MYTPAASPSQDVLHTAQGSVEGHGLRLLILDSPSLREYAAAFGTYRTMTTLRATVWGYSVHFHEFHQTTTVFSLGR